MAKQIRKKLAVPAQMSEAAVVAGAIDVLMTLPEISEAYTRADIELALEDRAWSSAPSPTMSQDLDQQTRKSLVTRSRMYWHKDPLAKQAVRLWTDYAFGREGISWSTEDEGAQKKISAFMKSRCNRTVLRPDGQRKSSRKLLIDGEVFFALYDHPTAGREIRWIDPLQVVDLITEPDDEERVIGFRRLLADQKTYLCYPAWDATGQEVAALEGQKQGAVQQPIKWEADVVVYHVALDTIRNRGNGLLFAALDWSREHRRFMEARVAIVSALSKYAHKLTVKGGQAILDGLKNKLQSSFTGATDYPERNPVPAKGSVWAQNAGMELEAMPRATGAGDAKEDGNGLKLMVSAATGIFLHYFGDPSTGNLATATAMELPMLKQFDSYQGLWTTVYRDLWAIVMEEDLDTEDEATDVDSDLPPILDADLVGMAQFLAASTQVFPELKVDAVLQMILHAMRVDDIADVMKKIEEKRTELAAQQKEQDQQALALVNKGAVTPQESIDHLVAQLTRMNEAMGEHAHA